MGCVLVGPAAGAVSYVPCYMHYEGQAQLHVQGHAIVDVDSGLHACRRQF